MVDLVPFGMWNGTNTNTVTKFAVISSEASAFRNIQTAFSVRLYPVECD